MVELVFTPTSAYRSSPGGAQIPENGYYTRFPWALIILRTASVQSSNQGNMLVQVTQAVESGHLCVSPAPLLPWACYRTSRLSLSFLGCEVRLLINMYLSVWLSINEEMCMKHITCA